MGAAPRAPAARTFRRHPIDAAALFILRGPRAPRRPRPDVAREPPEMGEIASKPGAPRAQDGRRARGPTRLPRRRRPLRPRVFPRGAGAAETNRRRRQARRPTHGGPRAKGPQGRAREPRYPVQLQRGDRCAAAQVDKMARSVGLNLKIDRVSRYFLTRLRDEARRGEGVRASSRSPKQRSP